MGGGKRAHGRPGSNLGAALKSARDKKNAGHRKVHDKDHGEHLHVSEVHQVHFFLQIICTIGVHRKSTCIFEPM